MDDSNDGFIVDQRLGRRLELMVRSLNVLQSINVDPQIISLDKGFNFLLQEEIILSIMPMILIEVVVLLQVTYVGATDSSF